MNGNIIEKKITNRERFLDICHCKKSDRVPNVEIGAWNHTLTRWRNEGLKAEIPDRLWLYEGVPVFGIEPVISYIDLDIGPVPKYKETVKEETERYLTITDPESGCTRKKMKDGLSMDAFTDFIVTDRASFYEHKKRFDPGSSERYFRVGDIEASAERHTALSMLPFSSNCPGLYAVLRKWMGTENVSYAFFDQPVLIDEMLDFWVGFLATVIGTITETVTPDFYHFFEDFAGKGGPLFSPSIFDRFFVPRYKELISYIRSKGIKTITIDSDGDIGILIPRLIALGFDMILPVEAAAGMDPVDMKKKYGDSLSFLGGIDKIEIMKGKESIRKELDRKLSSLLKAGGYIPSIDHSIPPGLSLEDFLYYLEIKKSYLD